MVKQTTLSLMDQIYILENHLGIDPEDGDRFLNFH